MHRSLILVVVVVFANFSFVFSEDDYYQKLYSKLGNVLKPSETLEALKTLDQEYKTRDDEGFLERHENVVELLDAGNLSEEKCLCFYTEYMLLQKLLLSNEKFPNIVDYLNYNKNKLFSLCKESLLAKLKGDIEKLPDYTEGFFELLRKSLQESADSANNLDESLFLIPYEEILQRGIINFLEKTSGPLIPRALDEIDGSTFFRKEYDLSIRQPCYIIIKQIESSMSDFYTLSLEDDMLKQFDPFAVFWLKNFNACMSIVGRGKAYSRGLGLGSYKLLLKEGNEKPATGASEKTKDKKSLWKSISSCFGLDC